MHKTAQIIYLSEIKGTRGKKENCLGWWEEEIICDYWLGVVGWEDGSLVKSCGRALPKLGGGR